MPIDRDQPYVTLDITVDSTVKIEAHNYEGEGANCEGLDATKQLEQIFGEGEREFKDPEAQNWNQVETSQENQLNH